MRQPVVAVVDDDTRVLESLEDLLESAGHRVHLYRSAQALLEDEAFGKIDCLISDIGMPAIDGFNLERLAHAARPELPVILITGRIELIKDQQTTAQGESRTILLKPFSERELLGAIDKALAPRPQT
ncbi:MAG TPA: response regulator [Steroidobacteraceae bacterium]|nr:response regulator [Steroidobacteraceae bacterium]